MRMPHPAMKTLLLATLITAFFPRDAAAYLDPGYGSYLFQILLGIVLTVSVSLGMAWDKTVGFFKTIFRIGNRNDPKK